MAMARPWNTKAINLSLKSSVGLKNVNNIVETAGMFCLCVVDGDEKNTIGKFDFLAYYGIVNGLLQTTEAFLLMLGKGEYSYFFGFVKIFSGICTTAIALIYRLTNLLPVWLLFLTLTITTLIKLIKNLIFRAEWNKKVPNLNISFLDTLTNVLEIILDTIATIITFKDPHGSLHMSGYSLSIGNVLTGFFLPAITSIVATKNKPIREIINSEWVRNHPQP